MMKRLTMGAAFLAVLAPAPAALAQSLGRLSYLEGAVSVHMQGAPDEQWSYGALNQPIADGAAIWTENNARADILAGPLTIHADHATEVDVQQLDYNAVQLAVPQGTVNIHVNQMVPGGIAVSTPSGIVNLTQIGSYSINSGGGGGGFSMPVQIEALDGQAVMNINGSQIVLQPGEALTVNGGVFSLVEATPSQFDNLALARDQAGVVPVAVNSGVVENEPAAYVPADVEPYQNLDQYGQWVQDPDYGTVWYPQNVQPNWSPYYETQWVDVQPWGYTTFHHGHWVQRGGRWGWHPDHNNGHHETHTNQSVYQAGHGGNQDWHGNPHHFEADQARETYIANHGHAVSVTQASPVVGATNNVPHPHHGGNDHRTITTSNNGQATTPTPVHGYDRVRSSTSTAAVTSNESDRAAARQVKAARPVEIHHPEQAAHLTATHQGWKRTPPVMRKTPTPTQP